MRKSKELKEMGEKATKLGVAATVPPPRGIGKFDSTMMRMASSSGWALVLYFLIAFGGKLVSSADGTEYGFPLEWKKFMEPFVVGLVAIKAGMSLSTRSNGHNKPISSKQDEE